MKIIDAVWEKRNLGVTCYELQMEAGDCAEDIEKIALGDILSLTNVMDALNGGCAALTNRETGAAISLRCDISARQADILRAGGLLQYTKEKAQ